MDKRNFCKNAFLASVGITVAPSILTSCNNNSISEEDLKIEVGSVKTLFKLPALSYSYSALAPVIDEETMRIHHTKHHQGYVDKLNKALKNYNTAYESLRDLLATPNIPEDIINNGGGHFNHSLYWNILTDKENEPSASLSQKISNDFSSTENLKEELINNGLSVFGSGWVWLCENRDGELFITTSENQDNPIMNHHPHQGNPILGIDVWEHAYYLNYQNERKQYLTKVMNKINWSSVESNIQTK